MSAETARDVIAKWSASNADRAQDIPYYDTADAILSALRSAGWAVVPVEPTEVMINAPRGLFLYEGPPNKKWTLGQHNLAGGYRLPITEREAALDYVNKATRASIAWRAMLKAAQEDSRG